MTTPTPAGRGTPETEALINPETGKPFAPGDRFGVWKGRFSPNELRSIRERNLEQPVPSLLDHIENLERDLPEAREEAAGQVAQLREALEAERRLIRDAADSWLNPPGFMPEGWKAGRDAAISHFVHNRLDDLLAIVAALPAAPADIDDLAAAMSDAYTYEDSDNAVPTLPFVDDFEGFWEPFAARVLAAAERPE